MVVDATKSDISTDYESLLEDGHLLRIVDATLLSQAELTFLRNVDHVAGTHKNIAYDRHRGRLTGINAGCTASTQLGHVMRQYAAAVTALVGPLCPGYALVWSVDLTSFRPLEEVDRSLPARARNDRLHIDAFPARPTHGSRILRVFTNIHPTRPRCWLTGDPLHRLLPSLQQLPGFPLPQPHRFGAGALRARVARRLGVPALARSAYDRYMLRVHDFMKQSDALQESCLPVRHDLAPSASWMLFTDTVPHAVLSGQYALEQTYIVPRHALRTPERSPLALFERIAGARLVHS